MQGFVGDAGKAGMMLLVLLLLLLLLLHAHISRTRQGRYTELPAVLVSLAAAAAAVGKVQGSPCTVFFLPRRSRARFNISMGLHGAYRARDLAPTGHHRTGPTRGTRRHTLRGTL